MILTCPECATSYSVDGAKLGAAGKTVRCAACGARWTAKAEADPVAAAPEPVIAAPEPEPEVAAAPQTDKAKKPAHAFRAKVAEKKSMRRAMVHGIVWAGMAGTLAAAIAVAVIFRVDVVKLMPRAASAYAMAGLPVNSIGLVFEDVSAHPALQDGHAALVVSGVIRNIQGEAVEAPPLRIAVLNKAGATVATTIEALTDATVAGGASHHFVIAVLDPPSTAEDVEVTFALGAKAAAKSHAPAEAHDAHAPALRGSIDAAPAAPVHVEEAGHTAAPAVVEAHPEPAAATEHH